MKIISVFNNKGGVGKTTYMFHIAHLLEDFGKKIFLVDLDSQCNISSYVLSDKKLEGIWTSAKNSIWDILYPLVEGIGDFAELSPKKVRDTFFITPGDILLSDFEDTLGDTWTRAIGGDARSLRVQSAFYRYILWASEKVHADIVFLDLGPNLGAINRCALASSDYFIVPMAPDMFSIRGTENLGNKLLKWRREWDQCKQSSRNENVPLPHGVPKFMGYVTQQYNMRKRSNTGMTKGWTMFSDKIENAIINNIVSKLPPDQVCSTSGTHKLGQIPNLNSLIPYSQKARKPVYKCGSSDGLTGQHITTARNSSLYFEPIAKKILDSL